MLCPPLQGGRGTAVDVVAGIKKKKEDGERQTQRREELRKR